MDNIHIMRLVGTYRVRLDDESLATIAEALENMAEKFSGRDAEQMMLLAEAMRAAEDVALDLPMWDDDNDERNAVTEEVVHGLVNEAGAEMRA